MARICVFDVNETLLDLAALDGSFESAFGRPGARRDWFSQVLQSAFVATITDNYADFGQIGRAALDMVAQRYAVGLTERQRDAILDGMRSLPPHPEVSRALERLQMAGLRLVALTNNTEDVARAQLRYSGLDGFFERILSADSVRRLKPAREPYEWAAMQSGVEVSELRLIAAHQWDIAGALSAGAAAAFVARPGMVLNPLLAPPDIIGSDLVEVADRILAVETSNSGE